MDWFIFELICNSFCLITEIIDCLTFDLSRNTRDSKHTYFPGFSGEESIHSSSKPNTKHCYGFWMILTSYKVSALVIAMCCEEQANGRVRIEDVC